MTLYAKMSEDVPAKYPLCLHDSCPLAGTCLRQLAFRRHAALGTYLRLVNPSRCTRQEGCPHYASSTPVRFALGFTGFQKGMYPEQYDLFMTTLIGRFGRNPYFKRRRGDILIPPAEQAVILEALRKAGVEAPMEFDRYVVATDWYT